MTCLPSSYPYVLLSPRDWHHLRLFCLVDVLLLSAFHLNWLMSLCNIGTACAQVFIFFATCWNSSKLNLFFNSLWTLSVAPLFWMLFVSDSRNMSFPPSSSIMWLCNGLIYHLMIIMQYSFVPKHLLQGIKLLLNCIYLRTSFQIVEICLEFFVELISLVLMSSCQNCPLGGYN